MSDRDRLDELKAAVRPDQLAAALGLRGSGRRFFCPLCQADGLPHKSPDLAIGDKGFICHRCGEKGDFLKLVELAEGLDFPDAVRWLEDLTGLRPRDRARKAGPSRQNAPRTSRQPVPTSGPVEVSAPVSELYGAFLDGCRPVEGVALDWLTGKKGVSPEVVVASRLRYCGREYPELVEDLKTRFGESALLAAGLLKKSSKSDRLVPAFWHYFASKVGFLVFPYVLDGRPVCLKVRPPVSKAEAERLKLVRFLNTAGSIPCLYNVDALKTSPDRVLICEGETDTLAALSAGWAAVGTPGAKKFSPGWADLFRPFQDDTGRSTVFLGLDGDAAGAEGSRTIARLFSTAGLPLPLRLPVPEGMDLSDYIRKDGMTS